ncbi:unnamed protein product [Linum tenue]|uniref:Gnk2-homologous domain-containing protein n=1 Tax=Linum tenue TaxID=586396 RepID=A0AAV0M5V8_9ROSI|nr:unnamed protein product [Linum tenue]
MAALAWLIIVVVGLSMITNDHVAVVVAAPASTEAYSFADHSCGLTPISPSSPLGQARKGILINVVNVHNSHPGEFSTCINVNGLWARAACPDPTSASCPACLAEAQAFLDKNCLYFANGRVQENGMTCNMAFGSKSVCR